MPKVMIVDGYLKLSKKFSQDDLETIENNCLMFQIFEYKNKKICPLLSLNWISETEVVDSLKDIEKLLKGRVSGRIYIVTDPENPKNEILTIDRQGIVIEGSPWRWTSYYESRK